MTPAIEASDLDKAQAATDPVHIQRAPLEPIAPTPLERGRCDWCGSLVRNGPAGRLRAYCNSDCRTKYNNLLARQGKSVMQLLKLWRKYRGRKGTPGEGKIGDIATRVDALLAEDRERKDNFK